MTRLSRRLLGCCLRPLTAKTIAGFGGVKVTGTFQSDQPTILSLVRLILDPSRLGTWFGSGRGQAECSISSGLWHTRSCLRTWSGNGITSQLMLIVRDAWILRSRFCTWPRIGKAPTLDGVQALHNGTFSIPTVRCSPILEGQLLEGSFVTSLGGVSWLSLSILGVVLSRGRSSVGSLWAWTLPGRHELDVLRFRLTQWWQWRSSRAPGGSVTNMRGRSLQFA
ncbi:hypothetical protein LINPERPRIM_LOCUS33441 [Linum perenne]